MIIFKFYGNLCELCLNRNIEIKTQQLTETSTQVIDVLFESGVYIRSRGQI